MVLPALRTSPSPATRGRGGDRDHDRHRLRARRNRALRPPLPLRLRVFVLTPRSRTTSARSRSSRASMPSGSTPSRWPSPSHSSASSSRSAASGLGAPAYVFVGVGVRLATLESGIHPTLVGVAIGLLVNAYPPGRGTWSGPPRRRASSESSADGGARASAPAWRRRSRRTSACSTGSIHGSGSSSRRCSRSRTRASRSGSSRCERRSRRRSVSPCSSARGGEAGRRALGAIAATRPALGGLPLRPVAAARLGRDRVRIGFTPSIFIADLAFTGERSSMRRRRCSPRARDRRRARVALVPRRAALPARLLGAGRPWASSSTSDLPVELDIDHVRGPADAPVTLVEYGDYQCPYCGMAESWCVLLAEFGDDLRYVWRHLPLQDVHVNAERRPAAEAGCGRFWELHDVLITHQDELAPADLRACAAAGSGRGALLGRPAAAGP